MYAMLCRYCFLWTVYFCQGAECVDLDEYNTTLLPGNTTAFDGDTISLTCSTNLPATYPSQWEINSQAYEITRIPDGFNASGLTLEFEFMAEIKFRCLFRLYLDGSVVDICSSITTITPTQPRGTQDYSLCPLENITFLNNLGVLTINIGLIIYENDRYFSVNLSRCNEPTSNIFRSYEVLENQSELLATIRLPEDFYGENINITTVDDSSDCAGMVYIPMFNRTVYKSIPSSYSGTLIDELSNDYGCDFVLGLNYRICIYSKVSNMTECFRNPCGNDRIYTSLCNNTTPKSNLTNNDISLEVNGAESGTIVSILCPGIICNGGNPRDILLFNVGIFVCDENADRVDGVCVCKVNYTGDGTQCETLDPSIPLNFNGTSLNPFTIIVSWEQPETTEGHPIVRYELSLSDVGSGPESMRNVEVPSSANLEYIFNHLKQNTTYNVVLQAVNNIGGTERISDPVIIIVTTLPVGPPQVPAKPTVTLFNNTSARISWMDPGGYPDNYTLQIRSGMQNWTDDGRTSGIEMLFYDLNELTPLTIYDARVWSINFNGPSGLSLPTRFRTVGPGDGGKDPDLSCGAIAGIGAGVVVVVVVFVVVVMVEKKILIWVIKGKCYAYS
ncbi:Pikachurin [Geodia barretti]|uniref:Pikachurin n=1 Tax=Geodia barretti TaxID=519541 RepID=A0AA35RVP2_GEOBA|nr:Pikachurin [Geodia barretti]